MRRLLFVKKNGRNSVICTFCINIFEHGFDPPPLKKIYYWFGGSSLTFQHIKLPEYTTAEDLKQNIWALEGEGGPPAQIVLDTFLTEDFPQNQCI